MKALQIRPSANVRTLKVGVVDDHALLAQSLSASLEQLGFDAVSLRPGHPDDVICFVREEALDVLLLDLSLGEVGSSLKIVPHLRGLCSKIVILTGETSRSARGECLEAGADSIIGKSAAFQDLVETISDMLEGETRRMVAEREQLLSFLRSQRENADCASRSLPTAR